MPASGSRPPSSRRTRPDTGRRRPSRTAPAPAHDDRGQPGGPREGCVRRAIRRDRRDRRDARTRARRPRAAARCPGRRRRGRREARQPRRGPALGGRRGRDAVIVADPLTDPFNPNAIRASLGRSSRCRRRRAVDRGPDWLASRGIRRSPRSWSGDELDATPTSPGRSRSFSGARPRACGRLARRDAVEPSRSRCRDRRQPERVDRRRGVALRGGPPTYGPARPRH
jgi:hypothetical protein